MRTALRRDDDYAAPGKPPCDWDDPAAREALVDALVHDALAALAVLDGSRCRPGRRRGRACWPWSPARTSSQGEDGVFRIARETSPGTG